MIRVQRLLCTTSSTVASNNKSMFVGVRNIINVNLKQEYGHRRHSGGRRIIASTGARTLSMTRYSHPCERNDNDINHLKSHSPSSLSSSHTLMRLQKQKQEQKQLKKNKNHHIHHRSIYTTCTARRRLPQATIYHHHHQRRLKLQKQPVLRLLGNQGNVSYFHSESEYSIVADETLEDIQDGIEEALESYFAMKRNTKMSNDDDDEDDDEDFEITLASGVLNIILPTKGTWVINKQTPNKQLWWSSPISGPRRYEYNDDIDEWVYTRSIDESTSASTDDDTEDTLKKTLKEELESIYPDIKLNL